MSALDTAADDAMFGLEEGAAPADFRMRGRASRAMVVLGVCCGAFASAVALHAGGMMLHGMHSLGEEESIAALTWLESENATEDVVAEEEPCLCVFDIDRTLTCKQGWTDQCDGTEEQGGVEDTAFSGGTLVLSQLGAKMQDTFCGTCVHGIVSAGDAGGQDSGERGRLLEAIGGTEKTGVDWWQDINWDANTKAESSLLVHAVDGQKQDSVRSMVEWWREHQKLDIKDENVWFFDDLLKNVEGFRDSGFNARQISCTSRGPVEQWVAWEGKIGGCGTLLEEVVKEKGVHVCEGLPEKPEGVED